MCDYVNSSAFNFLCNLFVTWQYYLICLKIVFTTHYGLNENNEADNEIRAL